MMPRSFDMGGGTQALLRAKFAKKPIFAFWFFYIFLCFSLIFDCFPELLLFVEHHGRPHMFCESSLTSLNSLLLSLTSLTSNIC